MKRTKYQPQRIAPILLGVIVPLIVLAACTTDLENNDDDQGGSAPTSSQPTNTTGGNSTGDNNPVTINDSYLLTLPNQVVNITEGSDTTVTVRVQRSSGYTRELSIGAEGESQGDEAQLSWTFANNNKIPGTDNATTVNLRLDYNALPIQPQERNLKIIATDGSISRSTLLTINVQPTDKPDVYLLVGQSNMVGFSEEDAKDVSVAGADEPNDRIKQLNVTGNDQEHFKTVESFNREADIAVESPRFTPATDPLHNGFDTRINGKGGTRIGLGLSFAKRALQNTQAPEIYLVPAAWANTGFCRRERPMFEGLLGWNTTSTLEPALSGTLLHDRAIARANLTLRETGGILRGILWHQGEADSENEVCASLYEQNLQELVVSLRSNIIEDARGALGRGENANIPFVVGTMSVASPYDFQPPPKMVVDGVHRNIKQVVPFSAFVNSDNLIPPDYPCSEDCIHFGAKAYREMGSKYYDRLVEAATGQ